MSEEDWPLLPMDDAVCIHDVILQAQERHPGEWRVLFDLVGHKGPTEATGMEGVKLVMSKQAFVHFVKVCNDVRDEIDPHVYPEDDPN